MQITWIGQAGLLIRTQGLTLLIDPYLSDSVGKTDPAKSRRVPVDETLFDIEPDMLLFTHVHLDHFDPETVEKYLKKPGPITVLAPSGSWQAARAYGGAHNYVLFDKGTEWTEGDIRFTAVPAVHSDLAAIGIVIEAEGKRVYITGDTLYSKKILEELPEEIDLIVLPVNGAGNNMNMADAARFARNCGAKQAMPVHCGMMDGLDPAAFPFENKIVPAIYKPFAF